jgi:hypothetical protein
MTLRTIDCNGEVVEVLAGDKTSSRLMDCGGETEGRPLEIGASQCVALEAKVTGTLNRTRTARRFAFRWLAPSRFERLLP